MRDIMRDDERGALIIAVSFSVVAVTGYLTASFPNHVLVGQGAVALLAIGKLASSQSR